MCASTPLLLGLVGLVLLNTHPAHSFLLPKTSHNVPPMRSSSLFLPLCATGTPDSDGGDKTAAAAADSSAVKEDMNPVTRASWYAVEAFGKVFGNAAGGGASADSAASAGNAIDFSKPPSSLKEALRRIELDNERQYFLSGEVDVEAYDPDCFFADPFVSFNGRQRFVDNLANLGSFITKYNARPLGYEVSDDECTVQTKIMVKLELNLPWKPVLAWPWGVTYEIDEKSKLITSHVESWDIEPWAGVKQIFRKPTVTIADK